MGLGLGGSFSVYDKCTCDCNQQAPEPKKKRTGNPNPKNYKVNRTRTIGKYLIAEITYPDCTNFEGRKVLVFEEVDFVELANMKIIDPHFTNDTNKSPIARFRPTEEGWNDAVGFAMSKERNG